MEQQIQRAGRFDIVQPLEKLNQGVNPIGESNLDVRININTRDVIGTFSRAFDRMISRSSLMVAVYFGNRFRESGLRPVCEQFLPCRRDVYGQ